MEEQPARPHGDVAILVVESDSELRDYLVRSLGSLSRPAPRLLPARDVAAAKAILETEEIALVIAALDSPLGGHAMCAGLGVGDRGQVPALLLTSATSSVIDVRAVRSLEATTLLEEAGGGALCRTVRQILSDEFHSSG